jgi:hypothetical protein
VGLPAAICLEARPSAGPFCGVPSMFDSLEVEVLYPA